MIPKYGFTFNLPFHHDISYLQIDNYDFLPVYPSQLFYWYVEIQVIKPGSINIVLKTML